MLRIQRHFVIRSHGKIMRKRITSVQQRMQARNEHPLQPFKRLKGVQAKRLGAFECLWLRRRCLPQLMVAQQSLDGVQLRTNAVVMRHKNLN
ncbi:hypothetical protein D3C85_1643040 [compost metagenome]